MKLSEHNQQSPELERMKEELDWRTSVVDVFKNHAYRIRKLEASLYALVFTALMEAMVIMFLLFKVRSP